MKGRAGLAGHRPVGPKGHGRQGHSADEWSGGADIARFEDRGAAAHPYRQIRKVQDGRETAGRFAPGDAGQADPSDGQAACDRQALSSEAPQSGVPLSGVLLSGVPPSGALPPGSLKQPAEPASSHPVLYHVRLQQAVAALSAIPVRMPQPLLPLPAVQPRPD